MAKNEDTKPMDPSIRENLVGAAKPNRQRNAYALDTLIAEVLNLFPETTYEVSGYNGYNTALHVQFYVESEGLAALLGLVESDERVEEVISDQHGSREVLVAFWPNARTQDSRAPFGLDDAWDILADEFGDFPGGSL